MKQDQCRDCDAPIAWVQTTNGKRMPVDVEPVYAGNVIIRERIGQVPLAFYTKPDDQFKRYVCHFKTCSKRKR